MRLPGTWNSISRLVTNPDNSWVFRKQLYFNNFLTKSKLSLRHSNLEKDITVINPVLGAHMLSNTLYRYDISVIMQTNHK